MRYCLLAIALSVAVPASAEEPRIWRDPNGGCAYVITPQGGIGLRYRRDGTPDCPEAQLSQAALSGEGAASTLAQNRRGPSSSRYW